MGPAQHAASSSVCAAFAQLGFFDLVFPGATHSRFAHSVGVYHMARRLARVIARWEGAAPRPRIASASPCSPPCLHDIGHGPFSHTFESVNRRNWPSSQAARGIWSARDRPGRYRTSTACCGWSTTALPERIAKLLTGDEPKDIYSAIVSSQFDADRLDYIQRDRLMTGVEFGHIDLDWLFDCLEVGRIALGQSANPFEAPCLYLGPKGVQVAEEYLEARFRLYRMVYMHKTARGAEKMLEALCVALSREGRRRGRAGAPRAGVCAS